MASDRRDAQTGDIDSSLLSQTAEAFQQATFGPNQVILSVLDDLCIGEGTTVGADLTAAGSVYLYAEQLTLSGAVVANGATIAANQIGTSAAGAELDASGAGGQAPTPPINTDPNAPSASGGDGGAGGALSVYLEAAAGAGLGFAIVARGGAGADGQQGEDGIAGGNGGNGGPGGKVVVFASHPGRRQLEQLGAIYSLTDPDEIVQQLQAFVAAYPGDPSLQPIVAALPAAGSSAPAPTLDQLQSAMNQAGGALEQLVTQWTATTRSAIDVTGGAYGGYGAGDPNGDDGATGAAGSSSVVVVGDLADLANAATTPPFLWAHPAQCAMALEQAKLMYLTADPVSAAGSVQDLVVYLRRIQDRCAPFVGLAADSPIAAMYANNEAAVGAFDSIATFQAIYQSATSYLGQARQGLDVFGYPAEHVPLGSYASYRDTLRLMIQNLQTIEAAYDQTYAQLGQASQSLHSIDAARAQAQSLIAQDQDKTNLLTQSILGTAGTIAAYTLPLADKLRLLDELIEAAEDKIDRLQFSFDKLLSALTMCAMAPAEPAMWIAQGSQYLYDSATQVTGDNGQTINTSYLVNQLTTAEASIDGLTEAYETLPDGELEPSDPGAAKILVEEQGLLSLISQVSGTLGPIATDLAAGFTDYTNTIVQRNNQILTYNALVQLLVKTQQDIQAQQAQLAATSASALQQVGAQPDWPSLTSYVSRLYYSARAQVLEMLDLTGRAFNFWALSNDDQLAKALGTPSLSALQPAGMDSALLASAQITMLNAYNSAVEAFGTNASSFPAHPGQTGIKVPLNQVQLALLQKYGSAMVQVPAALPGDSTASNPFAGLANVRLTCVRLWLEGAKTTSGAIQMTITHTGREQIVDAQGNVFTFSHDAKNVPFSYQLDNGHIFEDGTAIGVGLASGAETTTYALVGPFTVWQLSITTTTEDGLDLSGLTSAWLEFHGTNYAFAPGA